MSHLQQLRSHIGSTGETVDINGIRSNNRRHLLKVFIAANLLGALAIFPLLPVQLEKTTFSPILSVTLLTCQLIAYYLSYQRQHLKTATRLAIYSDLICYSLFLLTGKGLLSPWAITLPALLMIATMLLPGKESLTMVGVGAIGIAATAWLFNHQQAATTSAADIAVILIYNLALVYAAISYYSRLGHQFAKAMLRVANHDFLTGLLNRRAIDSELKNELQRAKREDGWLSIIMIDVDHFKQYNDQHGHLAGDKCLQTIAQTLDRQLRHPPDTIGRYGGEEFLAILPGTDKASAENVAQRIQQAMQQQGLYFGVNAERLLTLTLGIVSCRVGNHSAEQLIEIADKNLYKGKTTGRNQIIATEINSAADIQQPHLKSAS